MTFCNRLKSLRNDGLSITNISKEAFVNDTKNFNKPTNCGNSGGGIFVLRSNNVLNNNFLRDFNSISRNKS